MRTSGKKHGIMALRERAASSLMEMAEAFIDRRCMKTREIVKARKEAAREADTVEAFARRWYVEIAEPANRNPRNIQCILKDVIPLIGAKLLTEMTPDDIPGITWTNTSRKRGIPLVF